LREPRQGRDRTAQSYIASLLLLLQRIVLGPLAALEKFAQDVSHGESATGARPKRAFHGELESLRSSVERTFDLLNTRARSRT